MVKDFKLTFMYFKPSGKFYANGEAVWELTTCAPGNDTAYMYDAVDRVLKIRRNNEPSPGLSSSGLDFHCVINCNEGHPCLVTIGRME